MLQPDFVYFGLFLLLVAFGLLMSLIYTLWINSNSTCPSPYTGKPLRNGRDIHWMTAEKVLKYLFYMHDYHNQMFDLDKAAFCRETGRIFPNALSWYGAIRVDWGFLQKRFPGDFVSWGSLTEEQKELIADKHSSLEGFQTETSSSVPSPRKIAKEYAYQKPGPLYVDINTGVLLGWKCIPETELEVLIVQKPEEKYIPGSQEKL